MHRDSSKTLGHLLIDAARRLGLAKVASDAAAFLDSSAHTRDALMSALQSATQEFMADAAGHEADWLSQGDTLTLSADGTSPLCVRTVEGSETGDTHRYWLDPWVAGQPSQEIAWTGEGGASGTITCVNAKDVLPNVAMNPDETGEPRMVGFQRRSAFDKAFGERQKPMLVVYPAPDQDYVFTMTFPIWYPDTFDINDRPYWPVKHDLTVVLLMVAHYQEAGPTAEGPSAIAARAQANKALERAMELDRLDRPPIVRGDTRQHNPSPQSIQLVDYAGNSIPVTA